MKPSKCKYLYELVKIYKTWKQPRCPSTAMEKQM